MPQWIAETTRAVAQARGRVEAEAAGRIQAKARPCAGWQAGGMARRAWVAEEIIDEDWERRTAYAAARFTAHVEDEALDAYFVQGPMQAPFVDALSWARDQADVVILMVLE